MLPQQSIPILFANRLYKDARGTQAPVIRE